MTDPNETLLLAETFTAGTVTYTPFIAETGRVGYIVEDGNGNREFLYLNPSNGPDDRNIFIYQGETSDPSQDAPLHFFEVLSP